MDGSFRREKDVIHITGFQSNYSNWENEGMVTSFFLCILREEVILITQKEVNIVFNEQVRLCEDTMQKKTREYTGDEEDRLCAFKAAAALLHTTPERALAGMMAISYAAMIAQFQMRYEPAACAMVVSVVAGLG